MSEFFESGRIADVVLVVLALEAFVLWWYRRVTGRGPSPSRVMPVLAAGGGFALALRGALTGAAWPWIAAGLVGALVAHVEGRLTNRPCRPSISPS